ncbi:MAG TPA: helix-turn-helix transcriptional regulator [Flavobacterium sp.]|jgi:transcriptional regulator with XRE-family HTH domain
MGKDTIEMLLATIGKKIQQHRIDQELQPEDVAEMTGLTAATIRKIESGNPTFLSNFIVVALALGIHPKEVLDIDIEIKPLFELSDPRKEKTRLTARIEAFIQNDFFEKERTAKDVVNELAVNYETKTSSSAVSVILSRKVEEESLRVERKGKVNWYRRG